MTMTWSHVPLLCPTCTLLSWSLSRRTKVVYITRAMSEYRTESDEARAVARWQVGSCLRMVRKTKQWVLSRCLKVCTVEAFLMAAGISFQILGHSSWRHAYQSQLLQLEHWAAADWTSAGLAWAHKETEVNVDKQVDVWIESCRHIGI